jgi:aminoglycoside phosphotransferase (APT) family kinase protein
MSQPWSPELAITIDEAKLLIESQFSQLMPVKIKELGEGFDNTVFEVNKEYVFRFPRKENAVQLLLTENQLLPLLVDNLNIRIPEPIFFGQPTDHYKWPFTGYHLVRGEAPGEIREETRILSAAPLAQFFKTLHQFPVEQAEKIGVPYDQYERTNIAKRKEMLIENLKKAEELQLVSEAQTAFDWLNSFNDIRLNTSVSLVHGDCHIRNILVDEKDVITGIIDWGDTHIGSPAIDLSIAYSFLPPKARIPFFQIYGEVPDEMKLGAKFFAVYVSTILLLYGHDLKDGRLVASAKESLKLSLLS